MKIKNVVIWAWISWIVLAQKLAERGEEVLIIEKRNHIWGNCFDYYDENWILIHKYWPHIFHTDIKEVRDYVNQFTEFTTYQHQVLWFIDGNYIPIPFNFNSLYLCFPHNFAERLEDLLLKFYKYNTKVTIWEIKEKAKHENNEDLSFLVNYIYEKIFKNYTIKQWWIDETGIDPDIMRRVPVVMSRDNRYFQNQKYQWMPKDWYTKMFEKMLDNKNIRIILNTNYKDIVWKLEYAKLFVTSPIDEYFDYKYWELWYRNTLFKFETIDINSFQNNSIINYPNDYAWTRITEMKKFYPLSPTYSINKTVILKEYPWIWDIKSYPIWSEKDKKIFEKYHNESKKLKNVYFLWRLSNYRYLDMDKAIKNVLDFHCL
jgi:UDP-galactopyranose mutase